MIEDKMSEFRHSQAEPLVAPIVTFTVPYIGWLSTELFGLASILGYSSCKSMGSNKVPLQDNVMWNRNEAVCEGKYVEGCRQLSERPLQVHRRKHRNAKLPASRVDHDDF